MGVSKNRGVLPPKMDGENNGKPYEQMDDLGVFPYFWKHPHGSRVIATERKLESSNPVGRSGASCC